MLGFSKLNSEKTEAVVGIISTYACRTGEAVIKKRVEIYVGTGCQMKTFHYFFRVNRRVQLAFQELSLSGPFNLVNKTSVESALPDKHCV